MRITLLKRIGFILLGILFLSSLYWYDALTNFFWIFTSILVFITGISFLIIVRLGFRHKNKFRIRFGLLITSLAIFILISWTELFKSAVVLKATLWDDLSVLRLTLRENNQFELVSEILMFTETYSGAYKISGNQIVFIDKPYNNNFIPDTIWIMNNKIVLSFDENEKANLGFAQYFDIEMNHIKLNNN
jgi:hypothetical protein